jgi:hypothetical protein
MHFSDWDRVPQPIREESLRNIVRAYTPVLDGPSVWRGMTLEDWDDVPQPARSIAFLRMIWHWTANEQVGLEFGFKPSAMATTIGAIVMAESWFEHRAVNENRWGNRDLGLAQCSDFCRATIAAMAARGETTLMPREHDYFDPWTATRVATVWFERELLRAGGDVDLAIRAYHRGLEHALDEKGDAYLARVQRLRDQYIQTQRASPSWAFLVHTVRPH